MKRIILCLSLFAFFGSQAQQVNPVPDYVFSNKMSVGRNAVTDTAAYFSIGPRYGAIRGMMPPMVTDTASMSATKRNGLLIFSIQKNKYLYWDSVGSKWAEMAGTAGSAITGSGVAGYMPEFTTATNIDTTRLYHSNGRFVIGSTTTTNGVFNVIGGTTYLEGNLSFGAADRTISNISNNILAFGTNNTERLRIFANGRVGVNTTTDAGYQFDVNGTMRSATSANFATTSGVLAVGTTATSGYKFQTVISDANKYNPNSVLSNSANVLINNTSTTDSTGNNLVFQAIGSGASSGISSISGIVQGNGKGLLTFGTRNTNNASAVIERMRIDADGNVGIGTTTPSQPLHVNGNILTSAPSGGTAKPFKIGEAATVSPTSPNRTIRVEIDGTVYYIHAKTTND